MVRRLAPLLFLAFLASASAEEPKGASVDYPGLSALGARQIESHTERLLTDAAAQPFGCHQQQEDDDFVFSGHRP